MIQIKSFISTKTSLLDEKVNKWLSENPDLFCWYDISPYMSYTAIGDKGSYMIGVTIFYHVDEL